MSGKHKGPSEGFASRRGYRGHGAAPALPKPEPVRDADPDNPIEERGETPFVRGVAAVWNEEEPTFGIFSHWQCPHCGANLSKSRICLNACGLSEASRARFNQGMAEAVRAVDQREKEKRDGSHDS